MIAPKKERNLLVSKPFGISPNPQDIRIS